ncbi:autotransporter outer membrane beta-barrel domain-containing protein [Segnochrobactrum spirostomi]|uniref:autotransporter outer membrane beta-barrel domain-containing protein n=1 Tax=Segnochrobactrum spirostomi TaxID=2608987 RepID=UPI001AD80921|nr:autotransporter domain-containing protein [Segnochrobactrum spirostomi]
MELTAVDKPTEIIGIGFFEHSSVLYDLEKRATGITSFFVTDAPVETTAASPFTVTTAMGNQGQLGMAGVISGPGNVEVTSGAQLKLSADNTYTGETIIDPNGWLALVGPGTISQSSAIVNNGVFDISGVGYVPGYSDTTTETAITSLSGGGLVSLGSRTLVLTNASGTFSGTIADGGYDGGTGGALVIAGGTEILSGANTYTGGTAIAQGAALVVAGSIQGTVLNAGWLVDNGSIGGTVITSGLVSGNGFIGGNLIAASGGIISPGNSVGTLNVAGAVAFGQGSAYGAQLGPNGTADLINAGGPITIQNGATLLLEAANGTAVGINTLTILKAAGGVNGRFTTVNDDFATQYPFLDFAVAYQPNGLLVQSSRNGVPFTSAAQNPNQAAVAAALDTVPLGTPFMNAVVSLSDATAPAAFNDLSGGIYPSIDTVFQAQSVYLRDAVTGRLRQAFAGLAAPATGPQTAALMPGLLPTVWTQAYGSWGDGEGSNGVADVSRSMGGFVTGLDNPIGDNARIGVAAGYSQSQFESNSLSSSGQSDNYDLAVYGGATFGALGLRVGTSYTWHDLSVNRSISVMGFTNALSSSYDAGTTQVFAEAGYGISTPYADLEPFAGIAYVSLHTDAMSETGGAAGLQSGSSTQDNTFTTLGLRAAKGFAVNGGTLTASASLGWQYAFGDTTPVSTLSFEAGGSAFQETGIPIARNTALVGVGFDFTATPNVTVGLHYAGQLAGSSQDNAIDGRVSIKF